MKGVSSKDEIHNLEETSFKSEPDVQPGTFTDRSIDDNIIEADIELQARFNLRDLAKKAKKKLYEYYLRLRWGVLFYILVPSVSFPLWFASLTSCSDTDKICMDKMKKDMHKLILEIGTFGLLHALAIMLVFKTREIVLKVLGILIVVVDLWYIQSTSFGTTHRNHSLYNMVIAHVVIGVILFITSTFLLCKHLHFKSKCVFFTCWLVVILPVSVFLFFRLFYSCSEWNRSIHPDFKYSESGGECSWTKSPVCWPFVLDNAFKPMIWGKTDCSNIETNMEDYRRAARESKIVSFGKSTDLSFGERTDSWYGPQEALLNTMKSSTQDEIDNGEREVFIDFRKKEEGELTVKLKDVRTKGKGQNLLPPDPRHLNILRVFMDTVSRQRFFRTMPETVRLLKEYHFTQNKKQRLYEFFRFHSMEAMTYSNLLSSEYGHYEQFDVDPKYDESYPWKSIESFAREKGYVSGMASNFCDVNQLYNIKASSETRRAMEKDTLPDHEFVLAGCDKSYFSSVSFFKGLGPYTPCRKCFMREDISVRTIQYLYDFFDTYKDVRKFFTLTFVDNHEYTEEVGKLIDPMVANLFQTLIHKGHLDNTLVFFYSDHGDHFRTQLIKDEAHLSEQMNPFLILITPEQVKEEMEPFILKNTQRLSSHKDLFATYMNYLGFGDNKQIQGKSLLHQEIAIDRTCDQLNLVNGDDDCKCHSK